MKLYSRLKLALKILFGKVTVFTTGNGVYKIPKDTGYITITMTGGANGGSGELK